MKAQPSNQELMDAIVGVRTDVGGLKGEVGALRAEIPDMIDEGIGNALEQMVFPRFVELEDRFDAMDKRLDDTGVRLAETVTLDQLDRRLLSLKDELKDTGAKAIRKVTQLAQILHANNVLSTAQVVEVGRA